MKKLFTDIKFVRLILFTAVLVTGNSFVNGATFTVTRADDRNDICNSGTDCSLREAVSAARTTTTAGPNIVNFAPGLSLITLANEIEIVAPVSPIEIRGPGANLLTIDGGPGSNRIFSTLSNNFGNFTIKGMTLTGGNGVGNNRSGFGGAIHIDGGTMVLDTIIISGNTTGSAGGGVMIGNGMLRILNSTISGNTAFNCAGANNAGSQMTILNSTISGNIASQQGGGLCANGNTTLRNVTITGNTAGNGGGILKAATGTLDIGNSIVAGNGGTEIRFNQPGVINSLGGNLIGDAPGDAANTGGSPVTYHPTDILDTDPQLGSLASNGGPTATHALFIGSPAVDHGNNSLAVDPVGNTPLSFDQRGFDRIRDGNADNTATVDIGAFELRAFYTVNVADGGAGSLRQAIIDAAASGDAVGFSGSLFDAPQTIILTGGELAIPANANLAIYGTGINLLTISGNNSSRVFNIGGSAKLFVKGLTISSGNGIGMSGGRSGGGIYIARGGFLALNDSSVRNNESIITDTPASYRPALIFSDNNSVSPTNTSGGGGGIYNLGNLVLNRTSVNGNKVTANGSGAIGSGGGIYNLGAMELNNSSVEGNTADGINSPVSVAGGGIYNGFQSTATLNSSTVSGNIGYGNGGGINNNSQATLNLNNSTVSNNQALTSDKGIGGGIINFATINVNNSTIAANYARVSAPGVQTTFSAAVFNSKNSLYGDNAGALEATDFRGNLTSAGYNLIENANFAVITGTTSGNILGQDAQLLPLGNFGGSTKTQALRPTSPAIDKANNNFVTATDQRGRVRPFDNPQIPNAFDGSDIGAFERQRADVPLNAVFDFDGDNKTDIGIFRPSVGQWWINRSSSGQTNALQFGVSSDKPVPADFTGDGKADVAVYRPATGEWFILRSEDNSYYSFPFGTSGDVPVPADYDGDGKTDAAIFRESTLTWYIQKSSGGIDFIGFGAPGDKPVIADYDGDGKADIAITRVNNGNREWWIRRSSDGQIRAISFGDGNDKAVPGDYTGDGKADIAFWRPANGNWFIIRSEDNSFYAFPFGTSGDQPTPGDYDGDGKTDAAVFRPSNATWYQQRSTQGFTAIAFGITGDIPIPAAYLP